VRGGEPIHRVGPKRLPLRVEFFLKTDSGYFQDAEDVIQPGKPICIYIYKSVVRVNRKYMCIYVDT